ncbi:MAG: DHH family phosphoesterase [Oscillospiraceae bacterium]|nr:DHH family phosphoesterase [Oscillospiraceae bacterium]
MSKKETISDARREQKERQEDSRLYQLLEPRIWLYFVFLLAFSGVTAWFNLYIGAAEAAVTVLLFVVYKLSSRSRRREVEQYLAAASGDIGTAGNDFMLNAPFPMVIFRPDTGEIIWSNDRFLRITGEREHLFDIKISNAVPGFDTKWLLEGKTECPAVVNIGARKFSVIGHMAKARGRSAGSGVIATTYWIDVTENLALREEYYGSRPVVSILVIDNFDELCRGLTDNARSMLRSAIDVEIEAWAKPAGGLLQRYDRDRYLFLFEERYLTPFQEQKFALLDRVHRVLSPNGLPASISIGIGMDTGYEELFQFAALAVDMALSRGGDQAVIKNRFNFEFYGGKAKETERRTKVKSRVMANALGSLISSASTVYVMGHTFTDLDAIGACAGVVAIARKSGVRARIVVEPGNNPSTIMVDRLRQLPEYKDIFLSPDSALVEADSHSLVVVVDTNDPQRVVARGLLMSCNKVAVIDHHRRSASYIDNAALNYHEPFASSACELVTELMQYLLESTDILRGEAEALLAGIVLDTKSFTLRTGGRTFEAAAFLRRCGADTVEVKRLFQNNLSDTVAKFGIVTQAKPYRNGVVIARVDHPVDRVTAAQAADELLNVAGATASFVLFPDENGEVILSARSIGDVNVQVILEALGGGGNAAAAGAQVKNAQPEEVCQRLEAAIDKYFEDEGA